MEILESWYYYHIYNHANGSDNLFRNDDNYRFFLKKFKKYVIPIAEAYAYCLMPNHFHFLVRIQEEAEIERSFPKFGTLEKVNRNKFISKQLSNFFSSYTQSFNKVNGRKGSLFNKNFKRKKITAELYLKQAIVYIHLNPVYHGFADEVNTWLYSSYKAICSTRPTLINKVDVLNLFEDIPNFKACHHMKAAESYVTRFEVDY
ncbi:MAG: hypothetical protein V2I54_07365 [Bacteroidales bacterium]|jgi:REP element-mobilizing transposase RayT|nr:hypothetical protein [Bacteroidales bacterium]